MPKTACSVCLEKAINRSLKLRKRLVPLDSPRDPDPTVRFQPTDEEGGCGGDQQLPAAGYVLAHPGRRLTVKTLLEPPRVEAQLARKGVEIRLLKASLLREEKGVHFPEFPLSAGTFCGFRRHKGEVVKLLERKMAKSKQHLS